MQNDGKKKKRMQTWHKNNRKLAPLAKPEASEREIKQF